MHIAFNGWFWDQPFTGSGQYLRQLVKALRSLDKALKLTLIVPEHMRMLEDVPQGVDILRVNARGGQIGKVLFEQRQYPAAVRRSGATLAHIPYWGGPLSSPVPQIVTVHDVIPLSMPIYGGGAAGRLYFSLVRASAQGATHIITDSEFSKREIVTQIGYPEAKVTAIPLACGPEFHPRLGAERDAAVREKYNLPEDGYALYLGGFDIRKNLRALISAWTYAGPSVGEMYPLVLAGNEPSTWGSPRFPDLQAEIAARPGLETFIRWIGRVDEADKPSVYRMARAYVFPSRYEGFGLGPLEAMACGAPVIAANASCVPEVVGEAAYLVDPDDSRAIGGAIIAVLIQDDLRESLRNLGLARATAFSWERTAAETLRVYQQVAKQSP